MSEAELQALKNKLEKSEAKREKLRGTLELLKQKVQLTTDVIKDVQSAKECLKQERQLLAQKDKELAQQRLKTAAAEELAEQAAQTAADAARAAIAARDEAAAATRQLVGVRAQMQQLEAQCRELGQAVASVSQQDGSRVPEGMQQRLEQLQSQQNGMLAEMQRWRAALQPLAALAAATHGVSAAPAMLPAAPLAAPAPAAPPSAVAAAVSPTRKGAQQRKRQRGPTSPTQERQRAGTAAAQPTAAPAPEPPRVLSAAEVRAKAVQAMQAQEVTGKRAREPLAARARANAFTDVPGLTETAAQPPAKRAKLPAAAPGQPATRPPQPPAAAGRAAASGRAAVAAEAAAAGVAAARESESLELSANERHVEQQREQDTAADEAAHLLGRITSVLGPGPGGSDGGGLTLAVVHSVAADLQLRLANQRLPLPLLLTCFETAVLECAAPTPQLQYLQLDAAEVEAGQQHATTAAAAQTAGVTCPPDAAWFADGTEGEQQLAVGGTPLPRFAAVWCSRDALASHRLQWLLHCAAHIQKLERQYAAAAEAAGGPLSGLAGGARQPFPPALRLHMHRLVVGCCLAVSSKGSEAGARDCSSALRHTETEVCALAAAVAGLCRILGNAEAFVALVFDLMCCPAPAAVVLPPLAAAFDVWPTLMHPVAAAPGGGDDAEPSTCLHAALQCLCLQAAVGEEGGLQEQGGGGSLPSLLLERQPAAAVLYLRRLGQQRWGWQADAEGSCDALQRLRAELSSSSPQPQELRQHVTPQTGQAAVIEQPLVEQPAAAVVEQPLAEQPAPADAKGMAGVEVEEI